MKKIILIIYAIAIAFTAIAADSIYIKAKGDNQTDSFRGRDKTGPT